MTQTNETPSSRPLTAVALRQSWRELPVRVASVVTIGVLIVIVAVGMRAVSQARFDRRLIREGVRVDAKIERISSGSKNIDRSLEHYVTFTFVLPGETEPQTLRLVRLKPSSTPGKISVGDRMPLLVNPKNINDWTAELEPTSWLVVLATPLLLTPLAIFIGIIAVRSRGKILRLYEHGTLQQAKVIEAHRSALIPGQKVVKFSMPGTGRVLSAAQPDAAGPIARGELIETIVNDPAKPTRAIIARAYETRAQETHEVVV